MYSSSDQQNSNRVPYNLAHVFQVLNQRKEQKMIESYSVSHTTLEQIFVQLAGEDEETQADKARKIQKCKFSSMICFKVLRLANKCSNMKFFSILAIAEP